MLVVGFPSALAPTITMKSESPMLSNSKASTLHWRGGSNKKTPALGQIGTPDNMLNFWVRFAIEMGTGVRDILDYSRVFSATRRE